MSLTVTTIMHRSHLFEESMYAETSSIYLSEIMQSALLQLEKERRRIKLNVRCSELPPIKSSAKAWAVLFEELLRTIVGCPTGGRPLFLHIDCARVDEVDGYNGNRVSFHQLQFFTNMQAGESWFNTCHASIEACRAGFEKLQAKLLVNVACGNNCLYMINIPAQQ